MNNQEKKLVQEDYRFYKCFLENNKDKNCIKNVKKEIALEYTNFNSNFKKCFDKSYNLNKKCIHKIQLNN